MDKCKWTSLYKKGPESDLHTTTGVSLRLVRTTQKKQKYKGQCMGYFLTEVIPGVARLLATRSVEWKTHETVKPKLLCQTYLMAVGLKKQKHGCGRIWNHEKHIWTNVRRLTTILRFVQGVFLCVHKGRGQTEFESRIFVTGHREFKHHVDGCSLESYSSINRHRRGSVMLFEICFIKNQRLPSGSVVSDSSDGCNAFKIDPCGNFHRAFW